MNIRNMIFLVEKDDTLDNRKEDEYPHRALIRSLAEQLDESKGYRRHKSEMFHQSSNLRGCVAAKLRPSRDP